MRKIDVKKIVKSKDGQERCRRCFSKMSYRENVGTIKEWSPAPYAWYCEKCPVVKHDGSIGDDENLWYKVVERENRKRLSEYMRSVFEKNKKGGPGK